MTVPSGYNPSTQRQDDAELFCCKTGASNLQHHDVTVPPRYELRVYDNDNDKDKDKDKERRLRLYLKEGRLGFWLCAVCRQAVYGRDRD
jgi:hypothetical protein